MSQLLTGREILFEFHPIGQYVRVIAMDTKTMTEVSINGPRTAPEDMLKRNAIMRLEYVLKKKGLI